MEDETRPRGAGAYEWDSVLKQDQPSPEEFENPAGLSTDVCDIGETMPGQGIPGYDAEEDGG